MFSEPIRRPAWRVALTRDEHDGGPQTAALTARGFEVVGCPVLIETAPHDGRLSREVAQLDTFDWVICASVRAVRALGSLRHAPWPPTLRTAAVGEATGAALAALAPHAPPIVPAMGVAGADALWEVLAGADDWPRRRVLILTTPGGRTTLIDALRDAGAEVVTVDAYRMTARPAEDIRRDWTAARPDAAVFASPRAVAALVEAVGRASLAELRAIVAIGATTAAALAEQTLPCRVAPQASFEAIGETLRAARDAEVTT